MCYTFFCQGRRKSQYNFILLNYSNFLSSVGNGIKFSTFDNLFSTASQKILACILLKIFAVESHSTALNKHILITCSKGKTHLISKSNE